MGSVVWMNPAELEAIKQPKQSRLERDFDRYVLHQKGQGFACTLYHDVTKEGYASRCENYRKGQSKEWTFRMMERFHAGDIAQIDGEYWLANHIAQAQVVGFASFTVPCNATVTIRRTIPAQLDDNGRLLQSAQSVTIVDNQPAHMVEGQTLEALADIGTLTFNHPLLRMQLNPATQAVNVGDCFELDGNGYRITQCLLTDTDAQRTHGVIAFQAQRNAGE